MPIPGCCAWAQSFFGVLCRRAWLCAHDEARCVFCHSPGAGVAAGRPAANPPVRSPPACALSLPTALTRSPSQFRRTPTDVLAPSSHRRRVLHTCTGSVVHSSTGDLILTAAHCLAQGFPTTFVPGFAELSRTVQTSGRLMLSTSIRAGSRPGIRTPTMRSRGLAAPAADRWRPEAGSAASGAPGPHPHRVARSASSAMRPASGSRRSAARPARESPPVVTPRSCVWILGRGHQRLAVDQRVDGHLGDRAASKRRVHARRVVLSAV